MPGYTFDDSLDESTSGASSTGAPLSFDVDPVETPSRYTFDVDDTVPKSNAMSMLLNKKVDNEPHGFIDHTFDLLSRGQFASAAFFDELFKSESGLALGRAFAAGFSELVDPDKRLGFEDLIKDHAPVFAATHPVATELLGFVGNVALDPTTYLTFGTGSAAKFVSVGGKIVVREATKSGVEKLVVATSKQTHNLSKAGEKVYKQLIDRNLEKGLAGSAVRESADATFSRIITSDVWGKGLTERGGARFAGKKIGGEYQDKAIDFMRENVGLDRLANTFEQLPAVKVLNRTLNRNAELPHEYVTIRQTLENERIRIDKEVSDLTHQVFKGLNTESREKLGLAAARIDDATKAAMSANGGKITPEQARSIADNMLLNSGLTGEEFAAYSRMRRAYQDVAEQEQKAGLLSRLLLNYTPRRYNNIKNADELVSIRRRWLNKLQGTFTADEKRKFKDLASAAEAGYDPVLDAATLFATRVLESRQGLAKRQFDDSVKALFGGLDKVPEAVRRDYHYVGDGLYSKEANKAIVSWSRLYDKAMGMFRKSATVLRPSFGSRQVVSNVLQSYIALGTTAFKAFDPRSLFDAGLILNGKPGKFAVKSNLGHTYSGEELRKLSYDFGIIRGTSLDGVGEGTNALRTARGIAKHVNSDAAIKNVLNNAGVKSDRGFATFFSGLGKFTDWPSKVEDTARVSLFVNGLRLGHSPKAAADIVNKSLFDYANGLSEIEARYIRRIIPFWSFQRFAVPLIAEATAKNPGRILSMDKAAKSFFAAWESLTNDEPLNPSEREAIPNWLLEQPATFDKLDENHKAVFRTFNNFTPLDVFGFMRSNEEGEFDVEGTMRKAALAQMTPFIKLPFELLLKQDFFTGRSLPEDYRDKRNIGKVSPDLVIRHLAMSLGAEVGGSLQGAAVGGVLGTVINNIPNAQEAILKRAFGWEEGINKKTGEREVWINPYLVHSYLSVNPALSDVFKVADQDNTPLERAMQVLFGVGTIKVDLKEQANRKLEGLKQSIKNSKRSAKTAAEEDRDESFYYHVEQMNKFKDLLIEEATLLNEHPIRGD